VDSGTRLKLKRSPYAVPKFRELWFTNVEKNRTLIITVIRKLCILLQCQTLHTKLSERNSIKLRQTVGDKSR